MQCLYCYKALVNGEKDFHPACSRKIFGRPQPPVLPYTEAQMLELGKEIVKSHVTVTGVQPKLLLDLEPLAKKKDDDSKPQRFTIVGLWGGYILKPPTSQYPHLPELEDLTMHLAALAGIATVPHSLIRLQSGNLAYITKRIDRSNGAKLHMEDMCQLTERLTEDKYRGSYEQIAKAIIKYSANPGLDLVNFFEQVIFSFLTGNADMHFKNFSLVQQASVYVLAPAYDLVASALVVAGDEEELALNLNGRKRKLQLKDFEAAFSATSWVDKKAIENIYIKFAKALNKWNGFIAQSFIPQEMKERYMTLITERSKRLELTV